MDAWQVELPMYKAEMDDIGKLIVFNICMLGAVVALTELVKPASIMAVLKERIPSGFIDMSRKALQFGIDLPERIESLTTRKPARIENRLEAQPY